MILLDTNAIIWIDAGHPRSRALLRGERRLYVSPASLLELQCLQEAGRIRLRSGTVDWLTDDDRWMMDEPPAAAWFRHATAIGWTRDPFDRLIAAHAQARKWRLATGDARLLDHLGPAASIRL